MGGSLPLLLGSTKLKVLHTRFLKNIPNSSSYKVFFIILCYSQPTASQQGRLRLLRLLRRRWEMQGGLRSARSLRLLPCTLQWSLEVMRWRLRRLHIHLRRLRFWLVQMHGRLHFHLWLTFGILWYSYRLPLHRPWLYQLWVTMTSTNAWATASFQTVFKFWHATAFFRVFIPCLENDITVTITSYVDWNEIHNSYVTREVPR